MLRRNLTLQSLLLNQPESGMGYQIVEATTFHNKINWGIAYNAELLLFDGKPRAMLKASYQSLLAKARISTGEIKSLHVVTSMASTSPAFVLRETSYEKKSHPAKDAPIERIKEREVFKRFTAYENDHRITSDGRLRSGTYGTTEEDAKHVRTGKEAVALYALPNPKPPSNKWTIKPHKDSFIQYGIAKRAYGQPGGGVEVIFTKGTDPQTVEPKAEKIPDE